MGTLCGRVGLSVTRCYISHVKDRDWDTLVGLVSNVMTTEDPHVKREEGVLRTLLDTRRCRSRETRDCRVGVHSHGLTYCYTLFTLPEKVTPSSFSRPVVAGSLVP